MVQDRYNLTNLFRRTEYSEHKVQVNFDKLSKINKMDSSTKSHNNRQS